MQNRRTKMLCGSLLGTASEGRVRNREQSGIIPFGALAVMVQSNHIIHEFS